MPTFLKRGQVEIENLGGEDRTFRFNSAALARVEEELGRGVSGIMKEDNIGIRVVAALLWAAALEFDPTLTLPEVYEWIDDVDDLGSLSKAFMPALLEGMPGGKKRYEERKQKEAAAKAAPVAPVEEKKNSSTLAAS